MHNIDRTVGETGFEFGNEFGQESFEFGNETFEFGNETFEFGNESGEMHEALEMELATELLSVGNEAELEQFLGGLFKKVASGVSNFAKSSAGKALGGMLKSVAKKALPIAGAALGNLVVPGVGGAIGGKLAGMAGKAFGLELEGLSPEDREFEVARAYVRFASDAARRTARSPQLSYQPQQAARSAMIESARRYAPGLMSSPASYGGNAYGGNTPSGGGRNSGRWVRRGSSIIIYGI
jgi:hypothetical protein